jgi:diketogulonate reductase-like aldo/keto reductase
MITRREWLGLSLGAGAYLALTPALRALQKSGGKLIQRAIPSSGEMLPVIGLMFRNSTTQDPAALKEVLETLVDNGGRFFDTMHQSAPGVEDLMATVVAELGIQKELFLGLRGCPPGPQQPGPAAPKAQIEALFGKFKVPKLDLVQLPAHADPTHWPVLKEAKKEGRIRYIGATAFSHQLPQLESIMRNEPIDVIGVQFAVDDRSAEETILPLAQERKIGVVVYFPFGPNQGALFKRAGTTPLPEWAADCDATTWAQFFLKYVISHPAVTVVRTGTSQAKHMLDNIGGGIGRLPNEATRKRMAEFVDALPAAPAAGPPPQQQAPPGPEVVLSADILDRYVGEYRAASGFTMVFRRDGTTLFVKPGTNPEGPLVARSETLFSDPRGPAIEFQLDGQKKVTGLILVQGSERIPLERKQEDA